MDKDIFLGRGIFAGWCNESKALSVGKPFHSPLDLLAHGVVVVLNGWIVSTTSSSDVLSRQSAHNYAQKWLCHNSFARCVVVSRLCGLRRRRWCSDPIFLKKGAGRMLFYVVKSKVDSWFRKMWIKKGINSRHSWFRRPIMIKRNPTEFIFEDIA